MAQVMNMWLLFITKFPCGCIYFKCEKQLTIKYEFLSQCNIKSTEHFAG